MKERSIKGKRVQERLKECQHVIKKKNKFKQCTSKKVYRKNVNPFVPSYPSNTKQRILTTHSKPWEAEQKRPFIIGNRICFPEKYTKSLQKLKGQDK